MLDWMRKADSNADDEEDDWTLDQPELSLSIWNAMEATGWQHLPFPGGLLDQPDWLIHDLYVLAWRKHVLRRQLESTPLPEGIPKHIAFGE